MDNGYVFSWKDDVTIEPVESDPDYARGMHGYDPAENPEMLGFCVLMRWGATTPGRDVGPLDSLRIHPTVAKLLGVEPAEGAAAPPLDVRPREGDNSPGPAGPASPPGMPRGESQ